MNLPALLFALIAACFLLVPAPSDAVDLSGRSRTYLEARETSGTSHLMPIFEFLDLRAGGLGSDAVSFHFGGWVRYDLADESTPGKDKNSHLQYAYVSIKGDRADASFDLGRIRVYEGAASALVDGAAARADLKGGFSLAAFGGSPVETDFDDRSGDSVYGGRISHGMDDLYRLGVSWLEEKNNSRDYRREAGLDLWFRPVSKIELLGKSFYNDLTAEWANHSYYLTLGRFWLFTFRTSFNRISYRDYFTGSTVSAFRLDPAVIDPAEKISSTGEEIAFSFGNATATADYKKFNYEVAGDADYYGGTVGYSSSLKGGLGAGYHRMNGASAPLRYGEYRVYAFTSFGRVNLAADYLQVRYDAEINGVDKAETAVFAAGYALTLRARLGADIEYAKNPSYDKDVRGFVKVVYNFDLPPAGKGRK